MRVSARVRANRANAKRSTGPKTKAGKARSAQNARKHGLSITANMLPDCSPAVEIYASQLLGEGASDELRAAALSFAEAQVDIDRVRQSRQGLYEDEEARLKQPTKRQRSRSLMAQINYLGTLFHNDEKTGEAIMKPVPVEEIVHVHESLSCEPKPTTLENGMKVLAPKMSRLWRYEKRALSRRDKAERELGLLRQLSEEDGA